MILGLCEAAARSEGFRSALLVGTMAGEPLYRACGYEVVERVADDRGRRRRAACENAQIALTIHELPPLRRVDE
jgi:hypothetical protein